MEKDELSTTPVPYKHHHQRSERQSNENAHAIQDSAIERFSVGLSVRNSNAAQRRRRRRANVVQQSPWVNSFRDRKQRHTSK